MPAFIVRVVLHGAREYPDYENLHKLMESHGYLRQIRADDGRLFKLPTGTYRCNGENLATASTIRAQAASIAALAGFRYAVLVTEQESSAWIGLEEIVSNARPNGLINLAPPAPPTPLNPLFSQTTLNSQRENPLMLLLTNNR